MWVGQASSAASWSEVVAFGAALRRAGPALLLWVALCAAAAFALLRHAPPRTVATVRLALEQPARALDREGLRRDFHQLILDDTEAQTQLRIILSDRLLEDAFDALNASDAPPVGAAPLVGAREQRFAAFRDGIAARRVGLSYVIEISAAAPTVEDARRSAAAVASGYVANRVSAVLVGALKSDAVVRERLDRLRGELFTARLAMRRGELPKDDLPDAALRSLGSGVAPTASPGARLVAGLGIAGGLGFVSGLLAIALRQRADLRLHSDRRLRDIAGLRNLAPGSPRGLKARQRAVLAMRAALGARARGDGGGRIGIVGVQAGAGAALARSLADLLDAGAGAATPSIRAIDAPVRDDAAGDEATLPALDAAIVVVDPSRTTAPTLRAALGQLRRAGTPVIGAVVIAGQRGRSNCNP